MRKARRTTPTDPGSWPTDVSAVPSPTITNPTAQALYDSRMAQQQGTWDEMDRLLAANQRAWRERKKNRYAETESVDRPAAAEVEL